VLAPNARWQGFLEDTITIDWQTPSVASMSRELCAGCADDVAKARAIYVFVRDEIVHTADAGRDELPCRASQVLAAGTGIGFSKSHLLAALGRRRLPVLLQVRAGGPDHGTSYGFGGIHLRPRALDRARRATIGAQPGSRRRAALAVADPTAAVGLSLIYPAGRCRRAARFGPRAIAEHIPEELQRPRGDATAPEQRLRLSRKARTPRGDPRS
jgi:hypothetical protein